MRKLDGITCSMEGQAWIQTIDEISELMQVHVFLMLNFNVKNT